MVEETQSFKESFFGKAPEQRVVSASNGVVERGDDIFKPQDSLGKQDFLELLVAQLQHQDPLNPSEDKEFVAQLAQFSSLETGQNTEASIKDLATVMTDFVNSQKGSGTDVINSSATNLLGKNARVAEGSHQFDGTPLELDVHRDIAAPTNLHVFNSAGEQVLQPIPMEWETGTADSKISFKSPNLDSGNYTFKVMDKTGTQELGYVYEEGTVTGISYGEKGPILSVGNKTYGMNEIKQIVEQGEDDA